ncbi:unnamed protein product [Spirodela intermedia]|uniref:Uncharacterized protein n=1 Tax=Spirodela intermedia TaxID=51605 RepID=A0A7I8K4C4_SPIIN|nr:unnamed protein product [Spirodela intermedia]
MHAGTAQNSAWRLRPRNCLCDDGPRWPERGRSLDSQARILAEWLNDDGRGSAKATTSREGVISRRPARCAAAGPALDDCEGGLGTGGRAMASGTTRGGPDTERTRRWHGAGVTDAWNTGAVRWRDADSIWRGKQRANCGSTCWNHSQLVAVH